MADPIIKRGRLTTKVGTRVDSLTVSLQTNSDARLRLGEEGQQPGPLAPFALQGGCDGARLQGDWTPRALRTQFRF